MLLGLLAGKSPFDFGNRDVHCAVRERNECPRRPQSKLLGRDSKAELEAAGRNLLSNNHDEHEFSSTQRFRRCGTCSNMPCLGRVLNILHTFLPLRSASDWRALGRG